MLVRIVKMTFDPEKVSEFLLFFAEHKEQIRCFPGCSYLKVLQDVENPHIVFSYSHWDEKESLEKYRNSELFKGVWARTKKLFSGKPEAWSTKVLHDLA